MYTIGHELLALSEKLLKMICYHGKVPTHFIYTMKNANHKRITEFIAWTSILANQNNIKHIMYILEY